MEQEPGVFFVGVRNGKDVRKDVLSTTKSILVGLKRFEDFRNKRAEKIKTVLEMKNIMDELQYLNGQLSGMLPRTKLRAALSEPEAKPAKKRTARKKGAKELKDLEMELAKVETKISKL